MVASRSELQCCPGTGSGQQGPPDSSRKRARADGGERLLAKQEGTERRREKSPRRHSSGRAASAPPFVLTRSRPHASHGRAKETPAAGPFVPMAGATTRRAARRRRARPQPTAPRWPWRRAGAARCVALPPPPSPPLARTPRGAGIPAQKLAPSHRAKIGLEIESGHTDHEPRGQPTLVIAVLEDAGGHPAAEPSFRLATRQLAPSRLAARSTDEPPRQHESTWAALEQPTRHAADVAERVRRVVG